MGEGSVGWERGRWDGRGVGGVREGRVGEGGIKM